MKICAAFFLSILLVVSSAQAKRAPQNSPAKPRTPPSQSAPASGAGSARTDESKIDPGKEKDIRRLMELAGARAAATQIMDMMDTSVRPMITNSLPEGDYREKLVDLFVEKFQAHLKSEIQLLLDSGVPLYDKYFTHDDIKGLIQFYETPLGQKALSVIPQLSTDIQREGVKLGERLGDQSMMEVLAEHPELQKGLEEAQKSVQPQ